MKAAEEPGGDGHGSSDGRRRSPRVESAARRADALLGSAARCADALLGSAAAFLRLQAEFQPGGDVIKGAVETFLHVILLINEVVRFNETSL